MKVQTLIGSGSTHNFIQECVAIFLRLPVCPSPHFQVLVGNGQALSCDGYCPQVSIQLGSELFRIDFYILNIQESDIVLGVQWLKLLGSIIVEYQQLYMEFMRRQKLVRLQGDPLLQWN